MFKEMLSILTKEGKRELIISAIFFCFYGASSVAMLVIILNTIFAITQGEMLKYTNMVILIGLVLFKGICNMIADMQKHNAGFCVVQQVRERIILSLKTFSLGFYTDKRLGEMNTILHKDADNLSMVIGHVWSRMFGDFLVATFVFSYMLILNYKIAIIAFLLVLPAITFLLFSIKKIEKLENKNNNALLDMVSLFVEFVRGMPILKSFGKNDVLQKDLKEKTYIFSNTSKALSATKAKELSIYNFILDLNHFAIIFVASIFAFYGKIDVFKFIILAIISKEFYRPFHNMDMYYMYYIIALDSYKRLKNTFSEKPIYDNKAGSIPNTSNIYFDAVNFKYEDNSFALKDLNFEIREKKITALVGESGAGKSTITNLLLRFYDVQKGKITIDGIDIREIPYDELLKRVGLVLQNSQLFNNTIEENIRVGNKNASMEDIIEASKKARLHDFVMSLPDGYNTQVGEDASFLSGGQRQRISIARTFLKDSSILILDEITSNIDVINEELIQEAITELSKNKTVIIVAHRLKTIKNADNILVFKNGTICESGKHDELMAKSGEYYRLYEMQK